MERGVQQAMSSRQHVCAVVLMMLLLLPAASLAPADARERRPPAARPEPLPARIGSVPQPPLAGVGADHTAVRPSPPAPLVGYVHGRDGRLVAAVSSRDLLQLQRRLLQPPPRWLQRRLQPPAAGRVVIAYSSALRAAPPAGELPDRVVTQQQQPPPASMDAQLEAALRAAQQADRLTEAEADVQKAERMSMAEADVRQADRLTEAEADVRQTDRLTEAKPDVRQTDRLTEAEADVRQTDSLTEAEADVRKAERMSKAEADVRQADRLTEAEADVRQTDRLTEAKPDVRQADRLTEAEADVRKAERMSKAEADVQQAERMSKAEADVRQAQESGATTSSEPGPQSTNAAAVTENPETLLEGSGTEPTTLFSPSTPAPVPVSTTPVTVLPLDEQGDFEDELPATVETPVEPDGSILLNTDAILSNAMSVQPPCENQHAPHSSQSDANGSHTGRLPTAEEEDSGVLLAIANEEGGSGSSDGVGAGSEGRSPDTVPAPRDVRVHGPHVVPAARGRQPVSLPAAEVEANRVDLTTASHDRSAQVTASPHNVSAAAAVMSGAPPAEAQHAGQPPATADTVRREARGHVPAPAAPTMGVVEMGAVSAGCVVVAAVIVLGAVLVVHRTGVMKRRSILSDPPLDDTRLSYINASTEFSNSDLGDEMTNLENLDNDSFLNSLESMNDSVATQSCWSRDIRHSKL